jgi:hypothetical protein
MASKDFDGQRSAALATMEPISFTLFGREWVCQPMLPPASVMYVQAITQATSTFDILLGGLSFVGSVVNDTLQWDAAMRGAVIDGDTLLDLIVWLQGQYNDRYQERLADAPPTITPPTVGPVITPAADRDQLEQTLRVLRNAGGDIG